MNLTIKNLTKSFGEKNIFENFSYSFDERGVTIISGVSGKGKTTLLRIIAGLDKKHGGEVLGVERDKISYAFQEHRLFPTASALQNVALSFSQKIGNEEIEKSRKMLARLGFNDADMELMPSELSGGMCQRVSLARAFVKDSELLILDEPF